ncbi:MAG: sensor domain-containing diguanylate cyclase [Deltaproteobacteria bacterium]|nr:sensor domain-containing diguanylate cyclase [Deltaproteobacteria bacterium]
MNNDNRPQKSTVIDAKTAIFDKIFKENQELRERNYELSYTLKHFEELARKRESQHKNFADLEERILKAGELGQLTCELQKSLADDFSIPIANLSLIENLQNNLSLELQEILSGVENERANKLLPAISFISENDYNQFFPQNRPLVTKHPDPILLEQFGPRPHDLFEIASSAFVPLISRGRAIGTLNMASPDPEKFIPGTATDAVETLGRKLAAVIENTILTAQLQKLLRTDPLTNLYNRRTLEEILPLEFARAQRYGHPLSLVMLDLDDFKAVNDLYGHQAGDQVLAQIGTLISRNLRQHDIGLRYGGDEFTLLLPDTNTQQSRIVIAKLLQAAAATKFFINPETHLQIKLSSGLATYPDNPVTTAEMLLQAADQELYKNKLNCRKKAVRSKAEKSGKERAENPGAEKPV